MTVGSSDRKAVTGTPKQDMFMFAESGEAACQRGTRQSTEMLRARLEASVDLAKRHVAMVYRDVVGTDP